MAKKEEKSKAELYREERKARIAKANKKNARKGGVKTGSVVKRVVAAVVALAIVCGCLFYVLDNTGVINKMITAVEVGENNVNSATFYYYYYLMYQQALSTQENYSSYGFNYIDAEKAPDEQDYPYPDEDGKTTTWADQLITQAASRAQTVLACYNEAVKEGIKLEEDEQTQIDETIEQFKSSASSGGYSVNAYLKMMFGFGLKDLKKQLEIEQIASKYQEKVHEDQHEAVDDAALEKELKDNAKDYGLATIRYYAFKYDTLNQGDSESDEAFEARKTKANDSVAKTAKEIFENITDEDSFIAAVNAYEAEDAENEEEDKAEEATEETAAAETEAAEEAEDAETEEEEEDATTLLKNAAYSSISSAVEADAADWAFDSARKAGDLKFFKGDNGAYIVYVKSPRNLKAHSVTVRYCLIPYNDEMTAANDKDERTEAKDTATKLYDDWKKGEATEDTFAQLVRDNSKDTSTSEDGGLIDVRLNKMVSAFEDWCFDSKRKAGDCEVIEAEEYGYFIVYFVSDNKDDLDWKDTASEKLADAAYDEAFETLLGDDGEYVLNEHKKAEKRVSDDFCKRIKRNQALSSQSR